MSDGSLGRYLGVEMSVRCFGLRSEDFGDQFVAPLCGGGNNSLTPNLSKSTTLLLLKTAPDWGVPELKGVLERKGDVDGGRGLLGLVLL